MNRNMKALAVLIVAAALAACGGGGGSPGATPGSTTGGGTTGGGTTGGGTTGGGTTGGGTTTDPAATATARVADFALFADRTTLLNDGGDTATITVQAVDANRNVVSGATVSASSDQGSVFIPGSTTTDSTGTFTGTVGIGGDKADRDITVSVTVNGITKRTSVHVSGSRLSLAANPAAPQAGQAVTLTANLKDAGLNPIQGATVTFNSATAGISNRTATTNATGDATITFNAPATPGTTHRVSASGSGTIATDLTLDVLSAGGSVANVVLPAGVTPSLAASPNVLAVNSVGSEANKSVLRFQFLDSDDNPVPNVRVRFDDLTTGLPRQGAKIASGTSTLLTDPSGVATTQYISGQNSSSTNGVSVRACYSGADFASTTDCPNQILVSLTVAGQALAVSIGDDNKLTADTSAGTYTKKFAVTVADSAGRPVANAPVDISVDLTHYGKGEFLQLYRGGGDGLTEAAGLALDEASPDFTTVPDVTDPNSTRSWCPNEDFNRNGNVDPANPFGTATENYNGTMDTNGNPTLEPRKSDLMISYADPAVATTNAQGILVIQVTYSQRFATWLAYRIRITANVQGSQGMAERMFVADAAQADAANGSFRTPPYGKGSCLSPN